MKKHLLFFSAVAIVAMAQKADAQVTKLSNNTSLSGLVINNRPVFSSDVDGTLWTTNGTAAGTVQYTSAVIVDTTDYGGGIVFKNKLYFSGINTANGSELWVTDGTSGGTSLVKDIVPGASGSRPNNFFQLNDNHFLFFANTIGNGNELWVSDGTTAGTVWIKDIYNGVSSSVGENDFVGFVALNNIAYFVANDGINGRELWRSDGTAAGTYMVKNINPGAADAFETNTFFEPIVYNGNIYFAADNGTNGVELWKSNGTEAGTQLVKDIFSGAESSSPSSFKVFNGKLLFTASSSTDLFDTDLWITDGTTAGTKVVKDPGSGDAPAFSSLYNSVIINNKLIFGAFTQNKGYELWTTDGTSANTALLKDINPNDGSANPFFLISYDGLSGVETGLWNGKGYFAADDGTHGMELWSTDGTAAGTTLLKDIFPGSKGSMEDFSGAFFTANKFFFSAKPSNAVGTELFMSDGTAANTSLVKDIAAGSKSSDIAFQFIYNNQLYFEANDGDNTTDLTDLYKLDATVTSLPVTLLNFTATKASTAGIQLDWVTTNEINSNYFDVERSADGVSFSAINRVNASGNSAVEKHYQYVDMQAAHMNIPVIFYRLKMVDKDGSFKLSNVLPVRLGEASFRFTLSPNPVQDQLSILIANDHASKLQLRITDAQGKTVYQQSLPASQSVVQHYVNVAAWQKGVYYIQLITDSKTTASKFVKQ